MLQEADERVDSYQMGQEQWMQHYSHFNVSSVHGEPAAFFQEPVSQETAQATTSSTPIVQDFLGNHPWYTTASPSMISSSTSSSMFVFPSVRTPTHTNSHARPLAPISASSPFSNFTFYPMPWSFKRIPDLMSVKPSKLQKYDNDFHRHDGSPSQKSQSVLSEKGMMDLSYDLKDPLYRAPFPPTYSQPQAMASIIIPSHERTFNLDIFNFKKGGNATDPIKETYRPPESSYGTPGSDYFYGPHTAGNPSGSSYAPSPSGISPPPSSSYGVPTNPPTAPTLPPPTGYGVPTFPPIGQTFAPTTGYGIPTFPTPRPTIGPTGPPSTGYGLSTFRPTGPTLPPSSGYGVPSFPPPNPIPGTLPPSMGYGPSPGVQFASPILSISDQALSSFSSNFPALSSSYSSTSYDPPLSNVPSQNLGSYRPQQGNLPSYKRPYGVPDTSLIAIQMMPGGKYGVGIPVMMTPQGMYMTKTRTNPLFGPSPVIEGIRKKKEEFLKMMTSMFGLFG